MSVSQMEIEHARVEPMPANIRSAQPGGGSIMQLELGWGRLRRWWLRTFRPGYVARMRAARQGECPNCPHDIVDPRDLKFCGNVCGYTFPPEADQFAWRGRLGVARWGLAEIVVIGGGSLAVAAALASLAFLLDSAWPAWLAALPAAWAVFVVAFFRDPARQVPTEADTIVAPADGTIDTIEELDDCEFVNGPAVKIGIFLSVFNVHVNRAPDAGRVVSLRYFPGRFGNAMNRESARTNEQLWIALEGVEPPHRRMLVKQIAGAIARRIVCAARTGQVLSRGQKFGMIKFGSRTELYLPKEDRLCIEARPNQKARAGSTVLARYRDHR